MFPKEKQFAELLNKQKRKWEYPCQRFDLGNTTYQPDFYLPNEDLYIEVVGTKNAYSANREKILKFKRKYPHIKFVVLDFKGNPYPPVGKSKFPGMDTMLRIAPKLHKKIRIKAAKQEITMLELIITAIEQYLK